jgi:hypothetical protein
MFASTATFQYRFLRRLVYLLHEKAFSLSFCYRHCDLREAISHDVFLSANHEIIPHNSTEGNAMTESYLLNKR